nr:MAG TPA: hypothetical protein [Bacteriophage sp.]
MEFAIELHFKFPLKGCVRTSILTVHRQSG